MAGKGCRFPRALQNLKSAEFQLRGQFVRYANTRKRIEREYKNADVDGFLEAEKSFKKLRGHADLKTLINRLRPAIQQLRKAA